jgi:hypothetical protein
MTQTAIQRSFAPFKRYLPYWAWNPIRSLGTAILGPTLFAYQTGYWRSAFKRAALSKNNTPLPWYTYPSIDFLKYRNYEDKVVLEFGGGQSTLWWAERAKNVVTLEGDKEWYEKIKGNMPDNVTLSYVSMESREVNVNQVIESLANNGYDKYDVIIIDGLHRFEMIDIAINHLKEDGIIICDNAEGYGFYDGFKGKELSRVDFFGNAPGTVLPHSTSIYFSPLSFVFKASFPIPVIAKQA